MNLVCVFELCLYIIHKDFTDSCVPKSSITTLWTQKRRRINLSQNLRQMYPAPPEMNYVVVSLIIATMSPYVCANYLCHIQATIKCVECGKVRTALCHQ